MDKDGKVTLAGGVLASVGASVCCAGPLLLLSLGIGGAWIGNLTAFEPYRPLFLAVAAGFLILSYRKIYRPASAENCAPGTVCAVPSVRRLYKVLFWSAAALVLFAATFTYFAPLFY